MDEPGVDPERNTETYASITLEAESARWAGVPFTLRSGKSMPADVGEIAVYYRPLPGYQLDRYPASPNVFRLGLMQPYVRLSATAPALAGGPRRESSSCSRPGGGCPAYANLLLDMLRGDTTLFLRGDEAEETWRIIDPVAKAWAAGEVPMQTYPAGRAPPEPAR